MESFVVQNLYKVYNVNENKKRSTPTILLKYLSLIYLLFLFDSINKKIPHFNNNIRYFNTLIFSNLIYSKPKNILHNNLIKSIYYHLIVNVSKFFNHKNLAEKNYFIYKLPIKVISVTIHKNTMNKLLYYNIRMLIHTYISMYNYLNISRNSIMYSNSFIFIYFINSYLLKIRNY